MDSGKISLPFPWERFGFFNDDRGTPADMAHTVFCARRSSLEAQLRFKKGPILCKQSENGPLPRNKTAHRDVMFCIHSNVVI